MDDSDDDALLAPTRVLTALRKKLAVATYILELASLALRFGEHLYRLLAQGGGVEKIPDTRLHRYLRREGPEPQPPVKIFPYTFTSNFL